MRSCILTRRAPVLARLAVRFFFGFFGARLLAMTFTSSPPLRPLDGAPRDRLSKPPAAPHQEARVRLPRRPSRVTPRDEERGRHIAVFSVE